MDAREISVRHLKQLIGDDRDLGLTIVKTPPTGPDRLNDPADWWLDGQVDRVVAHFRKRVIVGGSCHIDAPVANVISAPAERQGPKSRVSTEAIIALKALGWKVSEIAKETKCSKVYVHKILQRSRQTSAP